MKIIVLKENLKRGLNIVEKSIGNSSALPILKNALIKADGNKINISSTNLELAITHSVAGKIIENGEVCVPFYTLNSLINNLPVERINLEKRDFNLIVRTDNYEAVIQGNNAEDFPIIPRIEKKADHLNCKSEILSGALLKVVNSAQFSEIRPEISGILFNYLVDGIKVVATDSFRLAEKFIPGKQFKSDKSQNFKLIIPLKTVQELLRILKDGEELDIFFDDNQILFKSPEMEAVSRLINGQYPDYESIIPQKTDSEILVNKDELINGLRLASIFAGRVRDAKIKSLENKKILEISSADPSLGENRYLISTKTNGGAIELAFNVKYLLDGLKMYESEDVILGLNGENKPSVIKSPQDQSLIYVLMPIKS